HGRLMTYPEIMASPVGMAARSEIYDEAGVDLLENTPDEITAITLEMEERLRGAWVAAPQDEALQAKFWSLMPRGEFHGEIRSRIGTAFLRAHPELLARGADVGAKP
ncbi:MAG TPA: TIGR04372 family glycosyltransferase, partial [Kiritimatiellia bacterium]